MFIPRVGNLKAEERLQTIECLKFSRNEPWVKATLYPKFWRIVKELKEVFELEEF